MPVELVDHFDAELLILNPTPNPIASHPRTADTIIQAAY